MNLNQKVSLTLWLPILGGLCFLAFLGIRYQAWDLLDFFVNEQTDPLLFVLLMVILPIFGFPITIFLVLCGVKFPAGWAVLLSAGSMGLHLFAVLVLTHTVLWHPMEAILRSANRHLPKLDRNKGLFYTFLFVAIPGPPYFVKNYLLAISRTPKLFYFGIGWGVQFLMGLPLVGIGGSVARMNTGWLLGSGLMAGFVYLAARWLLRKRGGSFGVSDGEF